MSEYEQSGAGDGQDQGMGQQDSGYGQDQSSQGGYGQDQGAQGGVSLGRSGAGGRANDLLGQAEGLLQGPSDPRAQQAEGLIDQARGFLGGAGQGDTSADTGSGDGQ